MYFGRDIELSMYMTLLYSLKIQAKPFVLKFPYLGQNTLKKEILWGVFVVQCSSTCGQNMSSKGEI